MTLFDNGFTACVIGASGGIGAALAGQLAAMPTCGRIVRAARRGADVVLDLEDPPSVEAAAQTLASAYGLACFDVIINATGLLHDAAAGLSPERKLAEIEAAHLARLFAVNATGPALIYRHFLPLLRKDKPALMAQLSARVGSISDNHLGGWYGYRAAKAAQNMITRNAALEWGRRHKQAVLVGLHPGTVATDLSAPFRGNVKASKLFTPDQSAGYLIAVMGGLTPADSGGVFDWDGQRVPA